MTTVDLESTATCLVPDGKGILAADETPGTRVSVEHALTLGSGMK